MRPCDIAKNSQNRRHELGIEAINRKLAAFVPTEKVRNLQPPQKNWKPAAHGESPPSSAVGPSRAAIGQMVNSGGEAGTSPDRAGTGLDDMSFPATSAQPDAAAGIGAHFLALGLTEYARQLESLPDAGDGDGAAGLAERFSGAAGGQGRMPERRLKSALTPYLAAGGLIVLAGIGLVVYVLDSGPLPDWSIARASPEIDSGADFIWAKRRQRSFGGTSGRG